MSPLPSSNGVTDVIESVIKNQVRRFVLRTDFAKTLHLELLCPGTAAALQAEDGRGRHFCCCNEKREVQYASRTLTRNISARSRVLMQSTSEKETYQSSTQVHVAIVNPPARILKRGEACELGSDFCVCSNALV